MMRHLILIVAALALSGCGCNCPPPTVEYRSSEGQREPTEAGSINCTLDARNCVPGQRR